MTDQQRCPECRSKAWNGWCGVCSPLPEHPEPDKIPAEKLVDTVPVQESLVVPDSVIEQAASEASHVYRESVGNGKPGNPIVEQDRAFAGVVKAISPLLVEHGAERERVKWEARIEKEAELFDARAVLNEQGMEQPLPSSSVARLLRSLLTEEGENGE